MNGDFLRYRGLIAVAVGAGVMVGAAGVFLYQQLFGERRRILLQEDINQLGLSVAEIRRELDALRIQQIRSHNVRAISSAPSVATEAETVMHSTVGDDEIDDEFYDFSSEADTATNANQDDPAYVEIDVLLDGKTREDKIKAYGLLSDLYEKNNEDEEVLWRLTKACHLMSSLYNAEADPQKRKDFLYKGVEFGQKALEINTMNWKAHKWFAICIGARGEIQSVKDKLNDGQVFKRHVDIALQMNPEDPTLNHLLGRFNYEVANLSWIERKVANTIFGNVPEGSYKDAIKSLQMAETSNPLWKENRLLLAKCYLAEKDYKQAVHWLDKAKEIPAVSAEEKLADNEINSLLTKYNSYRDTQS